MAVRRAPLLLAAALLAAGAAGPATAEREPRPVPRVSVRPPAPPAPPKGVTVGPRVSVPRVKTWREPVPRVSISVPPSARRHAPKVRLPRVTVYRDAVCMGQVVVGECPRKRPRRAAPGLPGPRVTPFRIPTPTPSPTPTRVVPARSHVMAPAAWGRRRNPLATVLLTVVVVTAISSTTAVAFRARR
ncbi:hypothetical protein ABGB18_04350 [Nonomuraea sp. B12E4]|uniref:hypothetical protein n=1 Tax=Nonomuraea sp. B12E4 TaxID=3153564 RepID=UPI00325CBC8E